MSLSFSSVPLGHAVNFLANFSAMYHYVPIHSYFRQRSRLWLCCSLRNIIDNLTYKPVQAQIDRSFLITFSSFMSSQEAPKVLSRILMHNTKHLHAQINDHPFMSSLGGASFSLEQYQQYLVNSHVIYEALENNLQKHASSRFFSGLNLDALCRSKRLREDIEFCKCTKLHPSKSALDYAYG